MLIPYHKLVRDNIPSIIVRNGQTANTTVLDGKRYTAALEKKLKEETREYLKSKDLTELADILEVVEALAKNQGATFEDVLARKQQKRQSNGAFEQRIFLRSVKK